MGEAKSKELLVGVNPSILLESLSKRLVEAHAGRGGIEAITQFLDQIDWIEEIRPLKASIKDKTVFFEAALGFCTKEQLSRPYEVSYREISSFMGMLCQQCKLRVAISDAYFNRSKCPKCGGPLMSTYFYSLMKLLEQGILPMHSPEAVLMNYAYDLLADAYVEAYKAFGIVIRDLTVKLGWKSFHLDRRIDAYLDSYFYGRLAGEQKIAREEKECLQFLARGNMVGIPPEEAEKVLRLGISVVKYGYLREVLKVPGADARYYEAAIKFSELYDNINAAIRRIKPELMQVKALRWRFKKGGGYYAPCFKLSKNSWVSGQITGDAVLTPYYNLPIFPTADMGAVQTVYGPLGSGKTMLLSSLICLSYFKHHETIVVPLNDKSNSYSLAALPMFAYSKDTAKLLRLLEIIGVEPQGIPTITVTVLRRGEQITDLNRDPPTIFDRVIEVDSVATFRPDFNILMDELKAEAEKYGLSVPAGMIVFRNLLRESKETYVDVEVGTHVLEAFDAWRKGHMSRPMRVVLDEVSYMASSRAYKYATDKLVAGATITDFIKESRRNNVSVDAATQVPVEVVRELRGSATNVFFRDIRAEREKTRSPIDVLLESLQLRDDSLKPIIRDMNVRGALPKNLWFWYHQPNYDIQIIRPAPPTFCIFDPRVKMSPREILHEYEKQTGQKVMLKSWSEVKRLEAEKVRKTPREKSGVSIFL